MRAALAIAIVVASGSAESAEVVAGRVLPVFDKACRELVAVAVHSLEAEEKRARLDRPAVGGKSSNIDLSPPFGEVAAVVGELVRRGIAARRTRTLHILDHDALKGLATSVASPAESRQAAVPVSLSATRR